MDEMNFILHEKEVEKVPSPSCRKVSDRRGYRKKGNRDTSMGRKERERENKQWSKKGVEKKKSDSKCLSCVGWEVLQEIFIYLRTVHHHNGKIDLEEPHDIHCERGRSKALIYWKMYSACKTQAKQAICMLPAHSLPAICTLLAALTALAESQMCLRGIWSFLETPPGAQGESDLWFSVREYIDLSSLITESSYNLKVYSLGVIWPLWGTSQNRSP